MNVWWLLLCTSPTQAPGDSPNCLTVTVLYFSEATKQMAKCRNEEKTFLFQIKNLIHPHLIHSYCCFLCSYHIFIFLLAICVHSVIFSLGKRAPHPLLTSLSPAYSGNVRYDDELKKTSCHWGSSSDLQFKCSLSSLDPNEGSSYVDEFAHELIVHL